MKTTLLLLLLFLTFKVFSQDAIIKTDGNEIESKIIEITSKTIKYKKYNHLDGPIRNIDISDVFMIIYENGEREKFSTIASFPKEETSQIQNTAIETQNNVPLDQTEENNIQEKDISVENSGKIIAPQKDGTTVKSTNMQIQKESVKPEQHKQELKSSQQVKNTTPKNTTPNPTETNSYKGKYSFLSLGYGTSYGGLGVMALFRTGSEFGFGMHGGIGYFPKAKYLASIGARLYLHKGLYVGLQYGRTGWEELSTYNSDGSNYESHVLNGYSYMAGVDWVWGKKKKVGMNLAIGMTKNNNIKYFKNMEKTLAIDVGFVFR